MGRVRRISTPSIKYSSPGTPITDVPGGILFANRNEGQRGQNSATILQDKAAAEH